MFKFPARTTFTSSKFSSLSAMISKVLRGDAPVPASSSLMLLANVLLFPSGSSSLSRIITDLDETLSERAINRASLAARLFIFICQLRVLLGPKVTPPPFHKGDRMLPCLALPVPFCFQGFLPPPRTSARVNVEDIGAR